MDGRHGDVIVEGFAGGGFGENTYLLRCAGSDDAMLVDPGAAVQAALGAAERAGAAVRSIVLTHAHIDHVDGVAVARSATGAPILIHPAAVAMYRSVPAQAEMFGLRMAPLPPTDGHLAVAEPVALGDCRLEVRETPGHAPGHVTLVGDGFALVGDCVFAGSIGRTDLPGGDLQTLMRSIREQILTLPDETVLYSGHGPPTTVGHERVSNPFLVPSYGGGGFV